MPTAISRTQIGQAPGQPIFPIHKRHGKKVELVQKKDERRQEARKLTDGLLDFRMQTIREFAMAAGPWFELIKEGKPLTKAVQSSLTQPLQNWLGALCDSPQVLYHERGDPAWADIAFLNYGPAVMRVMKKRPGERKAMGAGSGREPTQEERALVKSAAFTIDAQRRLYRLNGLEDKISRQPYNQLHPDGLEPKNAELIYFMSLALQRHSMLLDGAERRALLNWLDIAEKMLGDIYEYGEEHARTSARVTHMKKQLVVH